MNITTFEHPTEKPTCTDYIQFNKETMKGSREVPHVRNDDRTVQPSTSQAGHQENMDQNQQPTSEAACSHANAIYTVKTCTIWRDHQKTWFNQRDAKFRANNVRSDDQKLCLVENNLDKETMLEVVDILDNSLEENKYKKTQEYSHRQTYRLK